MLALYGFAKNRVALEIYKQSAELFFRRSP
jgi:hypothetical protein